MQLIEKQLSGNALISHAEEELEFAKSKLTLTEDEILGLMDLALLLMRELNSLPPMISSN